MIIKRLTYTHHDGWSAPLPNWNSPQTLVMVFADPAYFEDHAPFLELSATYPDSRLIGCSTSGEINQDRVMEQSLSVAVAQFEKTDLGYASEFVDAYSSSTEVGHALGAKLNGADLRMVLVLANGSNVNGSALVEGIRQSVGSHVMISGGLAGDGARFERTWVVEGGLPKMGYVTAIGFYGDALEVGFGNGGGWESTNQSYTVTHSVDNVLYELDGQPALEVYKRYIGIFAGDLPSIALIFPFLMVDPNGQEESLVRTILNIDTHNASMIFAGDIKQGYQVRFMRAFMNNLVQGAQKAAEQIHVPMREEPVLSIAVSCVGRRLVMKDQTHKELSAVLKVLPTHTEQVGFYSYGEISPGMDRVARLYNQTMTLTTLSERLN